MTFEDVLASWRSHARHIAEPGDRVYQVTGKGGNVRKTICACCVVEELGRAEWQVLDRRLRDYWGEEAA